MKCSACGEKWRAFPATTTASVTPSTPPTAISSAQAAAKPTETKETKPSPAQVESEAAIEDEPDWGEAFEEVEEGASANTSSTFEEPQKAANASFETPEPSANEEWMSAEDDIKLPTKFAASAKAANTPTNFNPLTRLKTETNIAERLHRRRPKDVDANKRKSYLGMGLFAASVLFIASFFVFSESVVRVSPDLASLYTQFGIKVNLRGFDIQGLKGERVIDNGDPVLLVTGAIVNVSGGVRETPDVRLGLSTNTEDEIYSWVYKPTVTTMVPGGIVKFRTRLVSPPTVGRKLSARFVDKGLKVTSRSF